MAAAQRRGNPLRVHVKVDTGMGRLGLLPEEVPRAVSALRRADRVELEGLYSHLACADSDGHDDVTAQQIDAFRRVLAACARAGWRPEIVHLANTAATLRRLAPPECNLARVGLGIYGLYPSDALAGAVRLSPALELKTRVTTVKRVPAGSGVSYGHTYHTGTETTLCTLPVGYADGLRRNLSGRVDALIKGRRHPIVGRICMDQCVVDVGDADVEVGDRRFSSAVKEMRSSAWKHGPARWIPSLTSLFAASRVVCHAYTSAASSSRCGNDGPEGAIHR